MKYLEKFLNTTVFVIVVFTMVQSMGSLSYAGELEVSPVAARVISAI